MFRSSYHQTTMSNNNVRKLEIAKNVFMPIIGIGTWELVDKEILHNVLDSALECGYRFIDTAAAYGNEEMIGESLKVLLPKHNLKREDVFITSKLFFGDHGTGVAKTAALKSLENLGTTYLDLYLVHYPGAQGVDDKDPKLKELRKGSWLDLEALYKEGKFKAIGVSNYMVHHLEEMSSYATVTPAVNQCEYHPHNMCTDVVEYCNRRKIHFQAYSSLGTRTSKENLFREPLVEELSVKYKCDKAQLLLSWSINQGISVIPKTMNPAHVVSNFEAARIVWDQEDIQKLKGLKSSARYCWDPSVVA